MWQTSSNKEDVKRQRGKSRRCRGSRSGRWSICGNRERSWHSFCFLDRVFLHHSKLTVSGSSGRAGFLWFLSGKRIQGKMGWCGCRLLSIINVYLGYFAQSPFTCHTSCHKHPHLWRLKETLASSSVGDSRGSAWKSGSYGDPLMR